MKITRDVVYATPAGEQLKADIFQPAGPGPFPGVLVIHGGAWMTGNKSRMENPAKQLAEHGYVACAIDYRLAPKYQFPAQIEDCKAAVRWMRANAQQWKIDPDRLGGFGYSAGGHLVALLATTDSQAGLEGKDVPADAPSTRLQAGVAGGAPCDFRVVPLANQRLSYWLGGSRADKAEQYETASPSRFVTPDDPPLFFFHGEEDELVPLAGVKAMTELLSEAGVPTGLYLVPKARHIGTAQDAAARQAGIAFLDKYLKNPPPAAAAQ